jgi:hypothetical protein
MKTGFKVIGLILGIVALTVKIVDLVMFHDSILDWWSRMIMLYIIMYSTSVLTIISAVTKDSVSKILSIIVMALSAVLLGCDGIAWLGFAASLNSTPMHELGIMPVCNIIHAIAGVFVLIGSCMNRN